MAQSYSGACEGLWSAEEGDRTYTFWTGNFARGALNHSGIFSSGIFLEVLLRCENVGRQRDFANF